jgi:hypothetical protein
MTQVSDWIEIENDGDEDEVQIEEYELTSSPNDFNVSTIFNFIESGVVKIPGFQRNYVWDIKRASKLIESIIIGLPVPQIFLYEEGRNSFLVIDGQQRLMSIFYFIKQRFPRKNKRDEIRRIFAEESRVPEDLLHDDNYFEKFTLRLPEISPGKPNKFAGRNYATLEDYKIQFDLRTIRNVIVKQNIPKNDDSSIYEIFNRLNTGGVNLRPQEIRASLYHSDFYKMLYKINLNEGWRRLLGVPEPDLNMRDVEILLRGFSMFLYGDKYSSSMAGFLNRSSKLAKFFSSDQIEQLERLFKIFLQSCSHLPGEIFFSKSGKFSVTMFESVFSAICKKVSQDDLSRQFRVNLASLSELRADDAFMNSSQSQSNKKDNVKNRLGRAEILIEIEIFD